MELEIIFFEFRHAKARDFSWSHGSWMIRLTVPLHENFFYRAGGCAVTAERRAPIRSFPIHPSTVHWSHTLRDNCEPSYVCATTASRPMCTSTSRAAGPLPQLRVTHSTLGTWRNSSLPFRRFIHHHKSTFSSPGSGGM